MLHNSNCVWCFFCKEFKDMGASWDTCSLFSDLFSASKAVEVNTGNCPCFVDVRSVTTYIRSTVADKVAAIDLSADIANDYIQTLSRQGSKYKV